MAGYVGIVGETLNIEDAYRIPPDKPYKANHRFDEENNYRTRSMLLVPMKDGKGEVIGVLALINARSPEGEILQLIGKGDSNKDIATQLFISESTVKAHLRNILEKLHLKNRSQVAAYAAQKGWLHNQ